MVCCLQFVDWCVLRVGCCVLFRVVVDCYVVRVVVRFAVRAVLMIVDCGLRRVACGCLLLCVVA